MKLLVYTGVVPSTQSLRIKYVETIWQSLCNHTPTKLIWVVCQSEKTQSSYTENVSIYDVREFSNAVQLLQTIKPDIIMVTVGIEMMQYSLCLAAKKLGTPIVSFLSSRLTFYNVVLPNSMLQTLRRFFSSTVTSDVGNDGKFMKRSRFFWYKFLFLLKTKMAIKMKFFEIIKSTLSDFPAQATIRRLPPNTVSNLYLAHHEMQINRLLKYGISKEKILLVGHPLLDRLHQKYLEYQNNVLKTDHINVLVITDSLYEHGLWSSQQRGNFLKTLFSELKSNNIAFSIKIHPSSEKRIFYENFLKKIGINTKVFQTEDLWDIITQYNIVISYGYSNVHTEMAYCGIKMILIDTGLNLSKFALVEEAIESGHIKECKNLREVGKLVKDFHEEKVQLSKDFVNKREKLFYKFDGRSSERAALGLINLLNLKKGQ